MFRLILIILIFIAALPARASINCSPSQPFTTTPSTTVATFANIAAPLNSGRFTAVFWRINCTSGKTQLMLTIRPTTGQPIISSLSFSVRQGSINSNVVLWAERFNQVVSIDIEAVSSARTYIFDPRASQTDDSAALTVIYNETTPASSFAIPATGGVSAPSTSRVLTGALSGAYANPNRGGEGFLIDIATVGNRNVIFVSMYTYLSGRQRWLVGNVDFAENTTIADIPMIETSGGDFGASHNPALVQTNQIGRLRITFTSCDNMTAVFIPTGATGGFVYNTARLIGRLKNVPCN